MAPSHDISATLPYSRATVSCSRDSRGPSHVFPSLRLFMHIPAVLLEAVPHSVCLCFSHVQSTLACCRSSVKPSWTSVVIFCWSLCGCLLCHIWVGVRWKSCRSQVFYVFCYFFFNGKHEHSFTAGWLRTLKNLAHPPCRSPRESIFKWS